MSDAQQLWNEGKYNECLEALRRTRKSSSEPQVRVLWSNIVYEIYDAHTPHCALQGKHNLVLAGYFSMKGTTPRQLYVSLAALSKVRTTK